MTNLADYQPEHFVLTMKGDIAIVQLNRPDRKNPLTFESYAELRDFFSAPCIMPTTSTPWFSPPTAAISAPAAMCTTLSGRWWAWI